MAGKTQKAAATTVTSAAEDTEDDYMVVPESELARRKLRERWELASTLNFLTVFEPVIQSKLKVSAEEIEMALIEPNNLLAQIHVALLKGIPPVSKSLNGSDAWVTALCKKLSEWWPWVAEGDLPLAVAKGEEISKYKELDPTIRLMILKALCEVRAFQDDMTSYVNDAIKSGSELSTFRKDKICGDENGKAYWLDGNDIVGYRLYKEVYKFDSKLKVKGKRNIHLNSQWETLATNLDEFRKVAVEFSSSKVKLENAVSMIVEADVIPVLEKLHKKKEKAIKQREREEMLLNGFRNSGFTRSCRSRRPVTYTFDEYDKAIKEAITIQQTRKRKTTKEQGHVERHGDNRNETKTATNESSDSDMKSRDSESTESDTESERLQGGEIDDNSDGEYDDEKNDSSSEDGSASNAADKENNNLGNRNHASFAQRPDVSRWSKRVAGVAPSPAPDLNNQGAKNRLRQRPTLNSSLDSFVAPDSEDETSPANVSSRSRSSESLSDDIDS